MIFVFILLEQLLGAGFAAKRVRGAQFVTVFALFSTEIAGFITFTETPKFITDVRPLGIASQSCVIRFATVTTVNLVVRVVVIRT